MESVAIVFVLQVFRIAVPYLFASVGAAFSERSGVVNLALEGLMLAGAFGGAAGQHLTGSAWGGVALGLLAGGLVALLHAFVTITLKANQIVSGIAINILVMGATRFGLSLLFGSAMNSARIAGTGAPSVLADPLFLIALLAVAVGQTVMFRTPIGLRLRAAGEFAKAVETAGVDVLKIRYGAVLASGVLAALGGVFLVFQQHSFTDNMVAGRGYIALAAMIIGRWTPAGAALSSLLFASAEAMQMWFQSGWIPSELVQSLPYVITLVVLAGFVGRSTPPAEAGVPYDRHADSA
jgi:simple sugar transport system permease protein